MAGYIGSQTPVVSNGSQRKYTFTATAAQTVFTGMDIPNPQQIQVFQNGVRLVITTDYCFQWDYSDACECSFRW